MQTATSKRDPAKAFERRRVVILLIVLSLSAALLGVQSVAVHKVLFDSFSTLEERQAERSLDQVVKALETDMDHLATSAHDYAVWDDAFNFVRTRDPHFIASNFTPDTLGNLNVDVVWMLDERGSELLSFEKRAAAASGPLTEAGPQVMQPLRAHLAKLLRHSAGSPLERLLPTEQGLLAIAVNPIVPSDGKGQSRGILVFGRFLNDDVVQRAKTTSQFPIQLHLSAQSRASLPAEARALWATATGERGRVLLRTSDTVLNGFVLLRDVDSQPVAIVSTSLPRNLIAFGLRTGRSLLAIFAGVVAVFASIVAGLLLYLEKVAQARAASERRYRAVITQARETMLLVDTQSRRILEVNPAASATLGYSGRELLELDIDDLFYACDGDVLKPVHAETHAATSSDRILIVRCKNKEFIDVEVTASTLVVDGREVSSFVLRDVSGRKRAERQIVYNKDQLSHQAQHDILTGLLNRLGLEHCLPEIIEQARRAGHSAAFLYIDIDHFKKINDLRGHPCGDKLLQIAAERLRQCVSSEDLVVRMGGDEFVVVAGGLRESSSAGAIAERVREHLARPFIVDEQQLKVTASVGVSVYPQDGADYEVLLKNADIALYESKGAGRDAFTVFANEMTQKVTDRLALEAELRDAIKGGQFYLDYQPLVDLKTQKIASFEALVRWRHPVRGRVPPLQFIEIAERTGLICDIGEFVIRETCRQIGEWQRCGVHPVPVAVNVSSKQLEQRGIVALVQSALNGAQIAPALLRIEITESVFIDAQDVRVTHLNQLRELGVRVSIDDFGTGYSSLAYLQNLPIDCLKIDRAFVKALDSGKGDDAILKAIIRMAHSLGLSIVAEGVETQVQAKRLTELGATHVQGFFYSPPIAADRCGRLLQGLAEQSGAQSERERGASLAAMAG